MTGYKTKIHLRDTDATGVLYFAEQFRLALEAFEHFLKGAGLSLHQIIEKGPYLMPIVHAEGDYFAPLRVDDEIEIFPALTRVGTTSFTVGARFLKKGEEVGKVSIVHVVMDKRSKRPLPIPEELRLILDQLPQHQAASL